jgi:hypothetical protein
MVFEERKQHGVLSLSFTPVTVTVCGVFQLPLVKVNDGVTVTTPGVHSFRLIPISGDYGWS